MIATPQIVTTAFKTAYESPPSAPLKIAPTNSNTHAFEPTRMVSPHQQDHVSKKLTYEDRDSGTLMFSIDDL